MANNVRLSGAQITRRSESDVRFNYKDIKQIIGASNDIGGNQAQFYSADGGATWAQTSLPPAPGDALQSDPCVDWTSDGTAWALTVGIGMFGFVVQCFNSNNPGVAWAYESTVSGGQSSVDKPNLWVDHSPGSPYKDNMYALWWNNIGPGATFVARRNGPAGVWNAPQQVSGAETTGGSDGGDIKTNTYGDVFAFWPSEAEQTLQVAKSTDGGVTFSPPVQIATTSGSFKNWPPAQDSRGALLYISGAAYRTTTVDHVYACWADLAGGGGCNSPADEPGANVNSPCKIRIWFSSSADGGATWQTPVKINDQPALNDQFFPRLALDENSGTMAVVYYDTIDDPGRLKTDVWMQKSCDGGAHWSKAIRLTSKETNETIPGSDFGNQYGDYIGLTGHAGHFFACWTDRRNLGLEEIWGAAFKVSALSTAIADSGYFGSVCLGSFRDELLTIDNTGCGPLLIFNIVSSNVEFEPPGVLSYPLVVNPGDSIDLVIRFAPTYLGFQPATITIYSNDPSGPHIVNVSGESQPPHLSLLMADTGYFGGVCVGSFADQPLILNNNGPCTLLISNIVSTDGVEFAVAEVLSYPLAIAPGDSLPVPIRFQPVGPAGLRAAKITVIGNDPTGPHSIKVSGEARLPRLSLMIADKGNFGKVCVGSFADEPLVLNNSSRCMLSITGIASSSVEFLVPEVLSYPLSIGPGDSLPAPIRFQPTSHGPHGASITVFSDDPAGPHSIAVWGEAPSGKIVVTGSTSFGGVKACCCAERTISVCNVGDCKLHVSRVSFRRRNRHWKLIHNPFPATLHPGSCLNLVIRYKATEKCPRCCELEIFSDDPASPVKTLELLAYTVWSQCGCRQCCDECRKGACDKPHNESCCAGGEPCCDDDDEDDDRDQTRT